MNSEELIKTLTIAVGIPAQHVPVFIEIDGDTRPWPENWHKIKSVHYQSGPGDAIIITVKNDEPRKN